MGFSIQVRRAISSGALGQVLYAVCQLGMISLLVRFGTPEIVGHYALGVAISAPILMLAQGRRRSIREADIRIISLVFALLGIAAVGFLEHSVQERIAFLIVAMAQSVEWVANFHSGTRSAVSLSLHGILSLAALGVILTTSGRPGAALLAVLIVRLLVLFLYDFHQSAQLPPPQDDLDHSRERMLTSITANVPFFFVAHMLGFHALGLFAAIASLTPAAGMFAGILSRAATPALVQAYQNDDRERFRRLTLQLISAGLAVGLSAVVAADSLGTSVLGFLFGPEYAGHRTLLMALAATGGIAFTSTLLRHINAAGRRDRDEVNLEIAAVAVTSLACVVLVPRLGLWGAASAAGAGVLVQVAGQVWILISLLRQPRKPVLMALLKETLGP